MNDRHELIRPTDYRIWVTWEILNLTEVYFFSRWYYL